MPTRHLDIQRIVTHFSNVLNIRRVEECGVFVNAHGTSTVQQRELQSAGSEIILIQCTNELSAIYFLMLNFIVGQLNPFHIIISYIFNFHFNIILKSMFWSPQLSLPIATLHTFFVSHTCYMCSPSQPQFLQCQCLVKRANYEASHYIIFCILHCLTSFMYK